jgi:hypothetical protein
LVEHGEFGRSSTFLALFILGANMDFPIWLKGALAAFVGGSANVITMVIVDPIAFNFGEQWRKTLVAALVGGALALAGYLKQSPVPNSEAKS